MKRRKRENLRLSTASVRPASSRFQDSWRELALPFGLLFLAAALLYARTVRFDFVDWDDDTNVFQNPLVISPTWDRFVRIWAHPYASLYVPLVYTSYLLDALIGGEEPWIYHVSNALYHFAAGCAVFLLLRDVIKIRVAALVGALVFVVHPMQAEAVAWVTGRKDVLSGCLALFALWEFSRFLRSGRGWDLFVGSLLFLGALLSKPSAVVVPFLALALGLYVRAPRKRLLSGLIPWFFLAVVWVFVNFMSQTGMEDAPFVLPLWKRPFLAADSLLFYAGKALLPIGLTPIYTRKVETVFSGWWVWVELPLVLAIAAGLWLAVKISKGTQGVQSTLALAAAWFAGGLLPILGLTPFLFQYYSTVADRYCYLAQLGTALFVACMVSMAAPRRQVVIGGTIVIVFAVLAWRPIGWWHDSEALWKRVLALNPKNKHAYCNLGTHYAVSGRLNEARPQFQEVIKLDPTYAPAYDHLIKLEMEAGNEEASNKVAEETIKRLPAQSVENYVALGNAYMQLKRNAEAAFNFRAAIEGYPEDARQYNNLGIALMRNKELKASEEAFRGAVAINDKFQLAQANLGLCLMLQNRLQEAADQFRVALTLNPADDRSAKVLKAIEEKLAKK